METTAPSQDRADSADAADSPIRYANKSAYELFGSLAGKGQSSLYDLIESDSHRLVDEGFAACLNSGASRTEQSGEPAEGPGARSVIALGRDSQEKLTLHFQVQPETPELVIVQVVPCEGWKAVDQVLRVQKRFRTALMELSQLAFTTKNDDEFYQRLIERAVEVVPGAQGGSVQLNIEGTTEFRFVASVGYDLAGLQQRTLDQQHFFRDALDPAAQIVRDFGNEWRTSDIADWLETFGRLSEIVVNVSAPVIAEGRPVAFVSLDNFEDPEAMTETSVEMTTVLSRLIGELWRRRALEATVRREREAYRHQALHDPLTGLANRRKLERSIDEILTTTETGHPAAVLFVDLDDFKAVNDELGHAIGDLVLIGVANGLSSVVRNGDIVGRWGGDEYLVIPRRLESFDEAAGLADRILEYFAGPLQLGNEVTYQARLTVGVGWSADSLVEGSDLVRAADNALYEAKAAGKGLARFERVNW